MLNAITDKLYISTMGDKTTRSLNRSDEMNDFFVSIVSNIPYGIITTDLMGNITMINHHAKESLNIEYLENNIKGENLIHIIQNSKKLTYEFGQIFKDGHPTHVDLFELKLKGKILNISGKNIVDGYLITINDITERRKERDTATLALLTGQEMERRRLAKEIHDGVGPTLSTTRLHFDSLRKDISDAPQKTHQKLSHMDELLRSVSTDIRSISHDLMPSALIDFGLIGALKNLCQKIDNSEKLTVHFTSEGMPIRLEQNLELNLYRIVQELMNNTIKYASAKNLHVTLEKVNRHIILIVKDNGIGIDTKRLRKIKNAGIGLQNIMTRTETLGGIFELDSSKGKGLTCRVKIPLERF